MVEMITLEHIKEYTPPAKLESLQQFMSGQGAPLGGYFPWDVQRWLENEHRELMNAAKRLNGEIAVASPAKTPSVRP